MECLLSAPGIDVDTAFTVNFLLFFLYVFISGVTNTFDDCKMETYRMGKR